jgi:hypothetical protein
MAGRMWDTIMRALEAAKALPERSAA